MEDTDWRPSPCPECGRMREAARNPGCLNPNCSMCIGLKPKEPVFRSTRGESAEEYQERERHKLRMREGKRLWLQRARELESINYYIKHKDTV